MQIGRIIMKRSITSLLLVILICALALMGCAQSAQEADEPVNIKLASEYPHGTSCVDESLSEKPESFEINGEEFSADYQSSNYIGYDNLKYNKYTGENVSIQVYEDSNILKRMVKKDTPGKGKKSFEECEQIAIDFVSQYISVDDYSLKVSKAVKDGDYHYFDFTRYIDETPTDDSAVVGVNTDGLVCIYSRNYSDAFSDGDFDIEQVRSDIEYFRSQEVYAEMDSIAREYKNYTQHNYFSSHLVSLGDKKYGMEYVINIDTQDSGDCLAYVVTR